MAKQVKDLALSLEWLGLLLLHRFNLWPEIFHILWAQPKKKKKKKKESPDPLKSLFKYDFRTPSPQIP